MPTRPCQICESRPADLLMSLTETGESEYVCLPCLPFRVVAYFDAAGVPGLQFGFGDDEMTTDAPPPEPEGDQLAGRRAAGGGKRRPPRPRSSGPKPPAEATVAGHGPGDTGLDADDSDRA